MPNYDFSRPLNLNNLPASLQNQMQRDPALVVPGSPPIFSQDIVPHFYTSTGYIGSAARAYPIEDEATRNSVENAQRMRTECGIMECLEARQRATALLKWHIVPEDDRSEAQRKLCHVLTRIIERTPQFVEYRRCLLEALWYGKYAVVNNFTSTRVGGKYRTIVGGWQPRHGDKLMFRYNDNTFRYEQGQLGIRVHANFGIDKLPQLSNLNEQQRRTKIEPTQYGLVYWFNQYERETMVVHKHLVEDGPWHDPRMMGRVMGVGIRDRIYWTWYAMQALLQDLLTYVSRASLGVRLWRYPSGNKEWKEKVEEAAKNALANGVADILYPVEPNEYASLYGVEQIEPGIGGAQMIRELIEGFFLRKIKKYILGQLLTSEAESTGMGSGVADAHLATFSDIVQYDAFNLQETLTEQLLRKLQKENAPKSLGVHLRLLLDTDTPDTERRLAAIQAAYQMDVPIKVEDVYQLTGITKPEPKDEVISVSLQQEKQQKQQTEMMMEQQNMMAGMGPQPAPGEEEMPPEAAIPEDAEQPIQEAMDVSPENIKGVEGPVVPADGDIEQPNGKWDGFFESLFRALREDSNPSEPEDEFSTTHTVQMTDDGQQEAFESQGVDPDLTEQFTNLFDCYVSHGMRMAEFKHDMTKALEQQNLTSELTEAMDNKTLVDQLTRLMDRHALTSTMSRMLEERVHGPQQSAREELLKALNAKFGYDEPERYSRGWAPYHGPRKGRGWKNIMTGEVRYQSDMPTDYGKKSNGWNPSGGKKDERAAIKPTTAKLDENKGYVGFDLDGTLAREVEGEYDPHVIGEPIPKMVDKAKRIMDHGVEVRIVTARVAEGPDQNIARKAIHKWTEKVFGKPLHVQAHKTPGMIRLYDNRAVNVETNTGNHTDPDDTYSLPSDSISPEKAEEMLKNPPHEKPLTEKQERMLHAAADKYTLIYDDGDVELYARKKSSPGQTSFDFEALHPRGQPNNAGQFVEKHEAAKLAHHGDKPATGAEKKAYAEYEEFVKEGGAKPKGLDEWLHLHRAAEAMSRHKEKTSERETTMGSESSTSGTEVVETDETDRAGRQTADGDSDNKESTATKEPTSEQEQPDQDEPTDDLRRPADEAVPEEEGDDRAAVRGEDGGAGGDSNRLSADDILQRVKSSPQMTADRDWDQFAERWGITGDFTQMDTDAETLLRLAENNRLGYSSSLDQGDIESKHTDASKRNPVIITKPENERTPLFVVDGTHSLAAWSKDYRAASPKEKSAMKIPVIISDDAAKWANLVPDKLPGGKADNIPAEAFDPDALKKGTEVESEHTDDPTVAAEIARDHLAEDPKYYDKLAVMEGKEPPVPKGMDPVQYRKGQADTAIGIRNPAAAGLKPGSLPWNSWLAGYDSMSKQPAQAKEPDPIDQIVQRVLDGDENVLKVIGDMGYTGKDKIDMYRKAREAVSAARTAKAEAEMSPGRRRARNKQRQVNPERHSLLASVHSFAASVYMGYFAGDE